MRIPARTPTLGVALAWLLLSGCGGNVDLGGKGAKGSSSSAAGGVPPVAVDPDPSPSEPVATLAKNFSLGTLAVAGDFLYFSGVNAKDGGELYRCRKNDCEATRELLQTLSGSLASLQVFGDRLGVGNYDAGSYWLGSYALPNASDPQIAIRDLPPSGPITSHFAGSFVYFALAIDAGIYRCALPNCPNGPERIGRGRTAPLQLNLCSDDQLVFWTDRKLIYRAGDYGQEPARALLPDELLGQAPAGEGATEDEPPECVASLTAGDGALYASVWRPERAADCDIFAPHRLVRWPSGGGPREQLVSSDAILQRVFLLGGELAWTALAFAPSGVVEDTARLSSCRVEACEATRRDLARVAPGLPEVVADERDLYWLEAKVGNEPEDGSGQFLEQQIRRAPRLPPP